MKKFFALAATALFIITSCSSDDAQPTNSGTNPNEAVLLKKTIVTDPILGEIVDVYNYDSQNRLISIIDESNGGGTYYTYQGNLITKIELKDENGNVSHKRTFEYDSNNRLTTYKSESSFISTVFKDTYVYNADGSVTTTQYSGDANSQTQEGPTAILTFNGGNIIKRVSTTIDPLTGNPSTITMTHNYTFDNKHTPEKNIPGFNIFMLMIQEGGVNNITATDYEGNTTYDSSYTYTYNEAGYPVTSTSFNGDGTQNVTIHYFYE